MQEIFSDRVRSWKVLVIIYYYLQAKLRVDPVVLTTQPLVEWRTAESEVSGSNPRARF